MERYGDNPDLTLALRSRHPCLLTDNDFGLDSISFTQAMGSVEHITSPLGFYALN